MGQLILPAIGEPRKRPPDSADEADAQALDRAVETMIQQVLSGWSYSRPLSSLNRADLRRLAESAITGWILERADMAACGNDQIRDELTSSAAFVVSNSAPILGSASTQTPEQNAGASAPKRRKSKKK